MGKVINLNEYRRKKMIKNMSQITFADINPIYDFIDSIMQNDEYVKDVNDRLKEEVERYPKIGLEELFSDFEEVYNNEEN